MANYYNQVGGTTVQGTAALDRFFAFTRDDNFDHINPDRLRLTFAWITSIRKADGSFFQITGTNVQISEDVFVSNGGTDVLYGSNRNDAIFYNNGMFQDGVGGVNGIQQFYLAAGDDIADFSAHGPGGVAFAKQLFINGEDGNDTIIGGANNDALNGGNGDDVIVGGAGGDTIDGGDGNDLLYGDDMGALDIAGQDTLRGRGGNDILYGGAKGDRLEGGDGEDILYGGRSDDSLSGGAGNDILYGDDDGFGFGDKLFGDEGDDELFGGGGNDVTDGGLGSDTDNHSGARSDYAVSLNGDGSFQVTDLRAGSPDGSDTVRNVEFFRFSDGLVSAAALNNPPVITSGGGGATATASLVENTTYVTTVTAADPDAGQTFSFSIVGGTDGAMFTIDAVTGSLAFNAAPDFENPTDANDDGIYLVSVRVSDGAGGIDTQLISVSVDDASDGAAPVISSNGGGQSTTILVDENSTAVTTVIATDPDGQPVSYRIVGGIDAARFAIDATTGALSFVQAPDFEVPTDADQDGFYSVIVEASDGLNGDRQTISVGVNNLNDNAPVITSGGGGSSLSLTLDENTVAVTTVVASDPDATAPTYSISGGADAARFAIDATTGALSFIAAPDFEQPIDANLDNRYDVVVRASDGSFTDEQAISVTIANLNDSAPTITSNGGGATAAITLAENNATVTTVTAVDADGGSVSYRISGGADAALFQINAATGALIFKSAPDFENPDDAGTDNVYDVTVEAFDGMNADAQSLAIRITDVNEVGRTLTGTAGNDKFNPTASGTAFRTTALNDTIFGLGGADTIDGGGGADRMEGGAGNDDYYIDTFVDDAKTTNDDLIIEAAGGGIDRANAYVSYRLAAEVENLTLLGTAAISGWGNDLANQMIGNAAANLMMGAGGNDTLVGNDGADSLYGDTGDDLLVGGNGNDLIFGGDGVDKLDGGTGADRMEGGAGNDTYLVDTWSDDGDPTNDDIVIEAAGGGVDVVSTSVSYRLGQEVENLTLTGTLAIDGTGNTLANTIIGNAAANILSGQDGDDSLTGGGGDDRLFGDAGTDILDGGVGNDLLYGGAGNDTLKGSAGNDTLNGGIGKDTLTGGADADIFQFVFGDTTRTTSNDRITDFSAAADRIDLDIVTAPIAAGQYAEVTIATNNFADASARVNSLPVGTQVAFVAGTTDGWLFWDGNADGIFDQSVQMNGLNSLNSFDSSLVI